MPGRGSSKCVGLSHLLAFITSRQHPSHTDPASGLMQASEGIEHTKSMPSAEATALVEGRRTADTLPPHWRRSAADPVRPDLGLCMSAPCIICVSLPCTCGDPVMNVWQHAVPAYLACSLLQIQHIHVVDFWQPSGVRQLTGAAESPCQTRLPWQLQNTPQPLVTPAAWAGPGGWSFAHLGPKVSMQLTTKVRLRVKIDAAAWAGAGGWSSASLGGSGAQRSGSNNLPA